MLQHAIETCADDLETLRLKLDDLTAGGARILSIVWQPRRPDPSNQVAAFDSGGSFVIVLEREAQAVLRRPAEELREVRT